MLRAKRGAILHDDLSAMPQRQLFSIASRRRVGLVPLGSRPAPLAMPHLRSPVLCLARSGHLWAVCPLLQMRKFRSGTHFSRTRGVRNVAPLEALAAFSGLPLRSLSRKIFQRTPIPPYPSLYGLGHFGTPRREL